MNNLEEKIKEANSFIKEMFSDLGFETEAKYSDVLNEDGTHRIYEFYTEIGGNVYYRINIIENLISDTLNSDEILIIIVRFGKFGNNIEIEKTFKIKDMLQNLDFIEETILKHYTFFMK